MKTDKSDKIQSSVPVAERPVELEKKIEALPEMPPIEIQEKPSISPEQLIKPAPLPSAPVPAPIQKEPVLAQIETIMEENLQDIYANLPADIQPRFKVKGEETARTIRQMMQSAKIKTGKILRLIAKWLKMIPGVSRFFLEQEAAIKAQKIIALAEENKSTDKA